MEARMQMSSRWLISLRCYHCLFIRMSTKYCLVLWRKREVMYVVLYDHWKFNKLSLKTTGYYSACVPHVLYSGRSGKCQILKAHSVPDSLNPNRNSYTHAWLRRPFPLLLDVAPQYPVMLAHQLHISILEYFLLIFQFWTLLLWLQNCHHDVHLEYITTSGFISFLLSVNREIFLLVPDGPAYNNSVFYMHATVALLFLA